MKTLNRLALFLHFFVGIGASAGGMGAILNPISPMGAPSSMLANSPFTDFLIPGIILFGLLGLGNLAAAALCLTRRPIANLIGGILGAALFIWIVVQCWMIRDIVALHVIFAVIGVAQGLIALILLWREDQFPMNIARRYVGLRRSRTWPDQTKTHLSRLVEQALAGEDVVISRSGKPLVRLVTYEERLQPVVFSLAHGEIRVSDDFDELSHDIAGMFDDYLPEWFHHSSWILEGNEKITANDEIMALLNSHQRNWRMALSP